MAQQATLQNFQDNAESIQSNQIDTDSGKPTAGTFRGRNLPFTKSEYFFILLPMALIFIGGPIGGMIGLFSSYCNLRVFRLPVPAGVKYVLSSWIAISGLAILLGMAHVVTVWMTATPY